MSPELSRQFENEWPLLARRLNALLARKQVPASLREDLIQETALRLYGIWERVDQTRSTWALTATIALNLMRDQGRRVDLSHCVAEVPELTWAQDVEEVALARVELDRVRAALALMTAEQRSVLLAEIGDGTRRSSAAVKMRRHRARRKLREVLEQAIALIFLPSRRLSEVAQGFFALRDSAVKAGSCLACMLIGSGSLVAVPFDRFGPIEQVPTVGRAVAAAPAEIALAQLIAGVAGDAQVIGDDGYLRKATRAQAREQRRANEAAEGTAAGAGSGSTVPDGTAGTSTSGGGSGPGALPGSPVGDRPIGDDPIDGPTIGTVEPPQTEPGDLPGAPKLPSNGAGEDSSPTVEEVVAEVEGTIETGGVDDVEVGVKEDLDL